MISGAPGHDGRSIGSSVLAGEASLLECGTSPEERQPWARSAQVDEAPGLAARRGLANASKPVYVTIDV